MKRLQAWITAEVRRQARYPRLEHALLTDRSAGYIARRLQLMGVRVLLRTVVHVLELYLLAIAQIPTDWLVIFIGYRTFTGVASSLYWGALEPMREAVRHHVHRRQFPSARLAIHNWLRVSALLGVLGGAGISAWIVLRPTEYPGFSTFNVFGIACVIRLAFDLWARTLHSGIFALRRVYRPVWSLLAPEIMEIALLIVLFPPYGLIAFFAMVVLGGVVRIGLANHYANRAYRGSRLAEPTMAETITARRVITWTDVMASTRLLLANATSQLDGVLIMLLLFTGGSDDLEGAAFVSVYYALRPLMGVAHGWVRTFYFDFKRIEHGSTLFRRRFHRLLTRTAIVLAIVVALIVLGINAWLYDGALEPALLGLVPFFVARSVFSVRQLEAFSYGAHRALMMVNVGVLLALGAAAWAIQSALVLILIASAALLLAHWSLRLPERSPIAVPHVVGLPRWLARLRQQSGPLQVHSLVADRTLTTGARLARRVSDAIREACVTRFGESHVLWFEPAPNEHVRTGRDVAALSDGAVTQWRWACAPNAATAWDVGIAQGVIPRSLALLLEDAGPTDLVREYREQCPSGVVIDAAHGRVSKGRTVGTVELRAVMSAITALARGHGAPRRGRFDILVYAPGGEPETIFITPIAERPSLEFRRRVQAASLRASF